MECPYCRKHISAHKTRCIYCGGKIEKNIIQIISDFFCLEKRIEKKLLKSLADGKLPVITSNRELELYIKYKIGDEEAAIVMGEALERIGNNGVMEIKRGGGGKPYRVERITNTPLPNLSSTEVENRIKQIHEQMNDPTKDEKEKEKIQAELALLVPNHVIIWINASSQEDYDAREQLINNAMRAMREVISGKTESNPMRTEKYGRC